MLEAATNLVLTQIEEDYTGVTTIRGHLGHPEKARHLISNVFSNPFLKSPREIEHISDSSEDFDNYEFVALTNLGHKLEWTLSLKSLCKKYYSLD